jgi:hypothetical protein
MSDGLNTVPVLIMHLEEVERVLDFVEGLLVSQDLQAEYRKMGTLPRPSKLTQKVQEQRARVQGYLQIEEDANDA